MGVVEEDMEAVGVTGKYVEDMGTLRYMILTATREWKKEEGGKENYWYKMIIR